MKNVIVACGGGIATSTIIADKVRAVLDEANIEYTITQCTLSELTYEVSSADLIVTSMKVETDFGVPNVLGAPFLTGLGEEETKEKIIEILSR
ncbi:PTS galactitol transporter subunit IIB [Pullulanibacillus camelliae]|uniref:PTS galactitol transporter subunit IIB n=1 Tax=Pullulanibacillus camelliae TaxID=1707096 RepID=A0A8J2YFU0_9BACL|nr:PTS sugar transporter subunit IIB [Pullulanibacillus camelliae]GGE31531.1 PTS galactitol transporter subunit IIB [Pullulanibacillus camelliae]